MLIKAILSEFFNNLKRQKLRTFLTLFGIVWGTIAVIVLLSFGTGVRIKTMQGMHGLGDRIMIIFNGKTTKAYQGYGIGRQIHMEEEDSRLLAREIPEIASISPEYSSWSFPVKRNEKSMTVNVTGVYPNYTFMRNIIPEKGRFVNRKDQQKKRKVIFLGDELSKYLFDEKEPVGKYVLIGDIPFRVIGVMKKKTQNSSYNSRDKDRAFIPAATFSSVFGRRFISNLIIKPKDARNSKYIQDRLFHILGKKYKFDPTDKNALWVWDTSEFDKIMFYVLLSFNAFLGMIGAFTLIVGGIGVANIMFVAVKERTNEIGIKLAVGAKKRQILLQFFLESFLIVTLGGLIGFLVSLGIVKAAVSLPFEEYIGVPQISLPVVLITLLLISLIGMAASFFPARRAAQLRPVECLK
ncbi:MAG TPA: FtsX-like permease family protein [Bacteroidetes bacterium]|nr:FtsX-like permease family protein [Bacteroidota bacterium]